jgi:hypothetical protein
MSVHESIDKLLEATNHNFVQEATTGVQHARVALARLQIKGLAKLFLRVFRKHFGKEPSN